MLFRSRKLQDLTFDERDLSEASVDVTGRLRLGIMPEPNREDAGDRASRGVLHNGGGVGAPPGGEVELDRGRAAERRG